VSRLKRRGEISLFSRNRPPLTLRHLCKNGSCIQLSHFALTRLRRIITMLKTESNKKWGFLGDATRSQYRHREPAAGGCDDLLPTKELRNWDRQNRLAGLQ